jgi:hypothetical protein
LPADFETNRHVHYAAIRTPLDGQQFVDDLKKRLGDALTMFNDALADGTTGGVKITQVMAPLLTRQGYGYHSAEALIGMATTTRPGVNPPPTRTSGDPFSSCRPAVATRQPPPPGGSTGWPVTASSSSRQISNSGMSS